MSKKRRSTKKIPWKFKVRSGGTGTEQVLYFLELATPSSINHAKEITQELLDYYWEYYSELANQRSKIESELKDALIELSVKGFLFSKWQRAVKYKYALHPLSAIGSLSLPGGRFNIGDINPEAFPQFPAIYIAFDKDTALQETLGQVPIKSNKKLSAKEIALTAPDSELIASVSGQLDSVVDLRNAKPFQKFVDLMTGFELSDSLKAKAKKLKIDPPNIVKTGADLVKGLLAPDWRGLPMTFDVPSNPQIFGHLVHLAGIEGIVYPSKLTGKDCLAIFPRNFPNTGSSIQLDDDAPHGLVPRKIDAMNWRQAEMTFKEIEELGKLH